MKRIISWFLIVGLFLSFMPAEKVLAGDPPLPAPDNGYEIFFTNRAFQNPLISPSPTSKYHTLVIRIPDPKSTGGFIEVYAAISPVRPDLECTGGSGWGDWTDVTYSFPDESGEIKTYEHANFYQIEQDDANSTTSLRYLKGNYGVVSTNQTATGKLELLSFVKYDKAPNNCDINHKLVDKVEANTGFQYVADTINNKIIPKFPFEPMIKEIPDVTKWFNGGTFSLVLTDQEGADNPPPVINITGSGEQPKRPNLSFMFYRMVGWDGLSDDNFAYFCLNKIDGKENTDLRNLCIKISMNVDAQLISDARDMRNADDDIKFENAPELKVDKSSFLGKMVNRVYNKRTIESGKQCGDVVNYPNLADYTEVDRLAWDTNQPHDSITKSQLKACLNVSESGWLAHWEKWTGESYNASSAANPTGTDATDADGCPSMKGLWAQLTGTGADPFNWALCKIASMIYLGVKWLAETGFGLFLSVIGTNTSSAR